MANKMAANDISKKYVKMEQREHVLKKPGMYLGSIDSDIYELWLLNIDGTKMEKKTIKYISGLFKIFDEIVANASDHYIRLKEIKDNNEINLVKDIKVNIDKITGIISVTNSGDGIDIALHPEHKIYIPELIFGNLLTSTNYNDDDDKLGVGQFGIGLKVTNIFSEWFEVETVDAKTKQIYTQRFESNMSVINPPVIKKYTKKPYTTIKFKPDYKRFGVGSGSGGLTGLTDDMYEVMRKRVYDLCAIIDKDINIYFNDEKLEFRTFEKYVDLYIGNKAVHTRVCEEINERWEVIASYNEFGGFEQISFVNGLLTIRGGKHVEYILNQIIKKMTDLMQKKFKNQVIKPQAIRDNMILFIKCTVINPAFDSQSKETLTTPATKFGSKAEVSDKFIEKLYKSGMAEKIMEICAIHEEKTLKKTDGKKRDLVRGLPNLDDANWAGTAKSKECMLILTEGNSAASMALSGLSVVGRDKYGVFPLKGKVMNVKDMPVDKIANNDEITNIKKILGLESGKKYQNLNDLRYGGVMLMTDADGDGQHIAALIFNLFQTLWPSLIKENQFIYSMLTPIVKVKRRAETVSFYCITDFEQWREQNNNGQGWDIKYYKGLGTSTNDEAKEYFKNMKKITYKYTDKSDESIDLAFNKKRADERKEWLGGYDRNVVLDYTKTDVTYEDFIHKGLIHFSNYDLERSIPNMMDGLKISQRKIMFACLKRNLTDKEIRVAQLASYVSEHSAYHHGEASLQGAIIGMAQNFVGSNNINLLKPNGQFGSRHHNGRDAAQPRYIHTLLTNLATCIFRKQDSCILKYLDDDGLSIEPEHYIPIIPMLLVNGAIGIGTGFSTNIPSYDPLDIVDLLKRMLDGEDLNEEDDDIEPWYRGFKGEIRKIGAKYYTIGVFKRLAPTKIQVTELPIGYCTFDFKGDLEAALDKIPDFKKYENESNENDVKVTLHFTSKEALDKYMVIEANGFTKFENDFKLVNSKLLSTTNMYAFNHRGAITKYTSAFHMIRDFYGVRLDYYAKRKAFVLGQLQYDADVMANKIRFIKDVIAEKVYIHKIKKTELEEYLSKNKYLLHEDSYDYIIRIPIYNLTTDKVAELEAQMKKALECIEKLRNMTTEDIWLEELEEFEKLYAKF